MPRQRRPIWPAIRTDIALMIGEALPKMV